MLSQHARLPGIKEQVVEYGLNIVDSLAVEKHAQTIHRASRVQSSWLNRLGREDQGGSDRRQDVCLRKIRHERVRSDAHWLALAVCPFIGAIQHAHFGKYSQN